MPSDANSNNFPLLLLKITTATSAAQRTDSSMAFFSNPFFRLVNVTCIQVQRGMAQHQGQRKSEMNAYQCNEIRMTAQGA